MEALRAKLIEACKYSIKEKLVEQKSEMFKIQESANNETKSSMGDKYETGRAMAQHELEKATQNLKETERQLEILNQLKDSHEENVRLGSFIMTDQEAYFIAIPLGLVEMEGKFIIVISPASPIGKVLIGKNKGDKFKFNEFEKQIVEVYNH